MVLTIRGSSSRSVFRLNGADENSATYALGWVLEKSPHFRCAMLSAWFDQDINVDDPVISLQRHGSDGGYTDIEIQFGQRVHAIVEAKRWWDVPTEEQLRRYRPRLATAAAQLQRLVSISSADADFANRRLPRHVEEAEVVHQSWGDVRRIAQQARAESTGFEEKLWLSQLSDHLQEFVAVERVTDNTVYVVSLGVNPMAEGGTHTWIDVVEKDQCYFHPVGGGWPIQPPNYIGFRYHGKLQSVHHVDSFQVVEDLSTINPLWLKTDSHHFVYRLGPPMAPTTEVRTGNIFRNGRVYCAIDTLLSGAFKTVSDARDETKRRTELG
jgi:hypothetical protein